MKRKKRMTRTKEKRKVSVFRVLREKFVKMMLLHMNDNRNFYTYSCIDAMINEQEEHIELYPMRIHPRSRFRMFWETFYVGFTTMCAICCFVSATAFRLSGNSAVAFNEVCFVSEVTLIANIFFNFITGFYHKHSTEAVMTFSDICKHHVKTTLVFDSLGFVFGSPLTSYVLSYDFQSSLIGDVGLTVRAVGIILRLASPWYYLKYSLRAYYILDGLTYRFVEFAVLFPVMLSFISSMIIAFTPRYKYFGQDSTMLDVFNKFLSQTVHILTKNVNDNSMNAFTRLAAVGYPYVKLLSLVALVILFLWSKHRSHYKLGILMENCNEYMQLVNISERLKIRILKYYQESFGDSFYEFDIIDDVSSEIKDDIVLLKIAKVREEIAIFKMIPNEELILICTRLRKEVFFGNDVVAYSGAPNDRMYFIARGTVAFYTDEATEIFHIPATAHFLWGGIDPQMRPIVANYLACETTVVYSLTRTDFNYINSRCPVFVELTNFSADVLIDVMNYTKEKELEEIAATDNNNNNN